MIPDTSPHFPACSPSSRSQCRARTDSVYETTAASSLWSILSVSDSSRRARVKRIPPRNFRVTLACDSGSATVECRRRLLRFVPRAPSPDLRQEEPRVSSHRIRSLDLCCSGNGVRVSEPRSVRGDPQLVPLFSRRSLRRGVLVPPRG